MPTTDDCLSCKQTQDSLAETWQAEIAKLREEIASLTAASAAKDEALELIAKSSLPVTCGGGLVITEQMHNRVIAALSSSPAAVLQVAEDARVGKAVEEWHTKTMAQATKEGFASGVTASHVLVALHAIIAQAREGEQP